MKKKLIFLALFVPSFLMAQVDTGKHWATEGLMALNLNQVSLSNWTAGGVNSVAFTALGKFSANYSKNKFTWKNNLNLAYGMVKNEGETMKKSEDVIDMTTVAGWGISKNWAFTGYVNFKTQFADGYDKDNEDIRISTFMAPGYLTISPALRYQPVEWFYLLLSPVTAKSTFVLDQELANYGAFGVEPGVLVDTAASYYDPEGKIHYLYLGPFMEAYMKKDIAKGLNFESKLNILYTLLNRDTEPNPLEPYDMDISWENFFNYKFNSWLSASLFLHFVYYPGQPALKFETYEGAVRVEAKPNRKLQFKEVLGIGLTYSFPKK
jgi:hypothetical protein